MEEGSAGDNEVILCRVVWLCDGDAVRTVPMLGRDFLALLSPLAEELASEVEISLVISRTS